MCLYLTDLWILVSPPYQLDCSSPGEEQKRHGKDAVPFVWHASLQTWVLHAFGGQPEASRLSFKVHLPWLGGGEFPVKREVNRLLPALHTGLVPEDLRHMNGLRGAQAMSKQLASVEGYLNYVYKFIAACLNKCTLFFWLNTYLALFAAYLSTYLAG